MSGTINLDSSFLIRAMRGDLELWNRVRGYETPSVTCIAVAELMVGAKASQRPKERLAAVQRVVETLAIVYPDNATLEHYSDLAAHLRKKGTPIPTNDVWIASLCLQHDMPLAAIDAHFSLIEGLKLVDCR